MGHWTVESNNGRHSLISDATNYGHNFHANMKLRYKPATFEKWQEPARLDWWEKCYEINHATGDWFEWEGNQYARKPNSVTLAPWPRRYIEAYRKACGLPASSKMPKGSVQLLDKNEQPVQGAKLGANKAGEDAQADAVRSFLKSHGGILLIEIHDIPNLSIPQDGSVAHQERLLVFNTGLENDGLRLRAEQFLLLDSSTLPVKTAWQESFTLGWARTFSSRGFTKVAAPVFNTNVVAPAFYPGECW